MRHSRTVCGVMAALVSAWAVSGQVRVPERTSPGARSLENIRQTRLKNLKFALGAHLPSSTDCMSMFGVPCYSPQDIRKAYGISSLIESGFRGAGETIVIIVSFGSPTLQADLATFDAAFGLPDPPSLQVISPLGAVAFDPSDAAQLGWAGETSLDVEWAHAVAPDAKIVVLTSPIDETQGVQGLPQFLKLEEYALEHHLGHIISQSWGTAENTLFNKAGYALLRNFEHVYRRAAREHVTVLAAAGDDGTENVAANGVLYSFPTVLFPASSPLVTAVGGTSLVLDAGGNYKAETVWNDGTIAAGGASGGGISQYFVRPGYQDLLPDCVRDRLRGRRGIPDVALNADANTPIWFYLGFFSDPSNNGFYLAAGTSAAVPQWAGIIADANHWAGHSLGFLNPKLYRMGLRHQSELFHDIVTGNNGLNGLPGYSAARGWDLASGWGTPNFGDLSWTIGRDDEEE